MTDIYSTLIVNLSRNPLNFCGKDQDILNQGWLSALGRFPSCSETLTLFSLSQDETLMGVRWDGNGSSVLKASASITTERMRGKTFDEAIAFCDNVFSQFNGITPLDRDTIGDLALLGDVLKYPKRVRSVILPAHTLKMLINKSRNLNVTRT